jgi:hypothetical protein
MTYTPYLYCNDVMRLINPAFTVNPGYLPEVCCISCHEDASQGEPLGSLEIDGRDALVCCVIMREWRARSADADYGVFYGGIRWPPSRSREPLFLIYRSACPWTAADRAAWIQEVRTRLGLVTIDGGLPHPATRQPDTDALDLAVALHADPDYQAALRAADGESRDQPGVSAEDMIAAPAERRSAGEIP